MTRTARRGNGERMANDDAAILVVKLVREAWIQDGALSTSHWAASAEHLFTSIFFRVTEWSHHNFPRSRAAAAS